MSKKHYSNPASCPEFQRALARDVRDLDRYLREQFRRSMNPEKLRYAEPRYNAE